MNKTTYDVDFVIDKPHKPYYEIEFTIHSPKTNIVKAILRSFPNKKDVLGKFLLQEEIIVDTRFYNSIHIAFRNLIIEQINEAKKQGVYVKNQILTYCSIQKKSNEYQIIIKIDGEYHG